MDNVTIRIHIFIPLSQRRTRATVRYSRFLEGFKHQSKVIESFNLMVFHCSTRAILKVKQVVRYSLPTTL